MYLVLFIYLGLLFFQHILYFLCLMNLELNWKQIVLKVENENHKLSKRSIEKEKQLHQHLNHHLVSKLKLRDSICNKIRMQNAKLKVKLQEQMREKRNKSQAIQAAKFQRQNQYQLHHRYLKQSQDIIRNTDIMKRTKSFIDQVQDNKHIGSSKDSKPHQIKLKQAIKVDKPFAKEPSDKSIINMQKLYDSCIHKINKSIGRYKQKDHIRNTTHSNTEQNQPVSLPINQYITSSEHTLRNKPFRESPKNSRPQERKISPQNQLKSKKKKHTEYSFFRQVELEVKGEVKKLANSKKRIKSNKLIIDDEQDGAESQYSNLLKSNLK